MKDLIKRLDYFLHTKYYLMIVTAVVFLCWHLKITDVGFCALCLFAVITLLVCSDGTPAIPSVIMFVFVMSKGFNPQVDLQGQLVLYLVLAALVIGAYIFFFIKNRVKITLGRQFWVFLAMFVSFLLSGLFCEGADRAEGVIFILAFGGGAFLAYFFFVNSVTKPDNSYFAKIFLFVGIIMILELFVFYVGYEDYSILVIEKEDLDLGWGISNNIGAILLLTSAMTFYLAYKRDRYCWLYSGLAYLQYIAIFFTMSRGSMLCAVVAFPFLFAYFLKITSRRRMFLITSLVVLGILAVILAFEYEIVVGIIERIKGQWNYSSGRDLLYLEALDDFTKAPIFGVGIKFSHATGALHWYHNTPLQFLASAGIVGILAYAAYSVNKFYTLIRKGNRVNKFILFAMLMWTGYTMLDCGSFLISQVLMVVALLALAEKNTGIKPEENFVSLNRKDLN